jgi:two-component system nitrogen regulation response regulator NtrX
MPQLIESGAFKGDLYHRLNVVPVQMPELKERREDVVPLCDYFIKSYATLTGKTTKRLSDEAQSVLQSYDWPGNVRQLKNVVEWLFIMSKSDTDVISASALSSDIFSSVPNVPSGSSTAQVENNADIMSMPLREARELFEKQYLLAQVNRFGGNISKTSVFIGMERSALHRKLKSLKVHDLRINRKKGEEGEEFIDDLSEEILDEATA